MITGGATSFLMFSRSCLMSLRSGAGPWAGVVGAPGLTGKESWVLQPAIRTSANAVLETLDQALMRTFTGIVELLERGTGRREKHGLPHHRKSYLAQAPVYRPVKRIRQQNLLR